MIVEEGRTRDDITDVDELVHCWKNLNCPVFIHAVCRFYSELCKDLWASDEEHYVRTSSYLL
ncbi:Transcription repressor OFP17 [Linum grandiflorum]